MHIALAAFQTVSGTLEAEARKSSLSSEKHTVNIWIEDQTTNSFSKGGTRQRPGGTSRKEKNK